MLDLPIIHQQNEAVALKGRQRALELLARVDGVVPRHAVAVERLLGAGRLDQALETLGRAVVEPGDLLRDSAADQLAHGHTSAGEAEHKLNWWTTNPKD